MAEVVPNVFKREISDVSGPSSTGNIMQAMENMESEKSKQVAKMILVIMLPVVALVAKASILFSASLTTQNAATVLQKSVNHSLETTSGIHLIQVERGLTAIFLGSETAEISDFQRLANARLNTNGFLVEYTTGNGIRPARAGRVLQTGKDILDYIEEIRTRVDKRINITLIDAIELYTEVTSTLNSDTIDTADVPSRKTIWPLVVAFSAISRAVDVIGIQRALGGAAFASCEFTPDRRDRFIVMSAQLDTYLSIASRYHPAFDREFKKRFSELGDLPTLLEAKKDIIQSGDALKEVCKDRDDAIIQGKEWFSLITQYIQFMTSMELYITTEIGSRVPRVEQEAKTGMAAYLTVMIIVSFLCIVLSFWYSFKLNNMMKKLKTWGLKMREKSDAVKEEKKKTDSLLYTMMPKKVADKMKYGLEVMPESFDSVTIYFSDIVGWSQISTKLSPHELVKLLNDLYRNFDDTIDKYDVYKVETIADSYMCVSGLPESNGFLHVVEIGQMALDMMEFAKAYVIHNLPGEILQLRIGFHSGSCVAGVVGTKMPRYCLFGDTVNTASRMETNGEALKIHVSAAAKKLMEKVGGFTTELRGSMEIKGKGQMETHWLLAYERPKTNSPVMKKKRSQDHM